MKSLLSLILLLLSSYYLLGQEDYVRTEYAFDDGLHSKNILDLSVDSQGFLWVCTDIGDMRYDGSYFKNIKPSNLLDYNDRQSDVRKSFYNFHGIYTLVGNSIFYLNSLSNELSEIKYSKNSTSKNERSILGMSPDSLGGLLYWMNDEILSFQPKTDELVSLYKASLGQQIRHVSRIKSAQSKLLVTDEAGIFSLDSKTGIQDKILSEKTLNSGFLGYQNEKHPEEILSAERLSNGDYFIKTSSFFCLYDGQGSFDTCLNFTKGTPTDYCVNQDRLVLKTIDGISVIYTKNNQYVIEKINNSESVCDIEFISVAIVQDVIYTNERNGLVRYKKNEKCIGPIWKFPEKKEHANDSVPINLWRIDSSLFVVNRGKECHLLEYQKYDDGQITSLAMFTAPSIISSAFLFSENEVLLYSGDGFSILELNTLRIRDANDQFLGMRPSSFKDFQAIRLGDESFSLFSDESAIFYRKGKMRTIAFDTITRLNGDLYRAHSLEDGVLRIVSNQNVACLDIDSGLISVFPIDYETDSFIDAFIAVDSAEILILNSRSGIRQGFYNNGMYEMSYHYYKNVGLDGDYINTIAIDNSRSGVWMSMRNSCGFINFDPYTILKIPFTDISSPSQVISLGNFKGMVATADGVFLLNAGHSEGISNKTELHAVSLIGDNFFYNKKERIRASARPYELEFRHVDHTLDDPQEVRFQYKFKEDTKWQSLDRKKKTLIPYLPNGNISLLSRSASSANEFSEVSISEFYVVPELTKSPFFLPLLFFGILSLAIYFIMRARALKQEKLKAIEQKQRQIADLKLIALNAQMKPHFMFNCLNSIRSYVLQNKSELAADYLSEFSHFIRSVLKNSQHSLISLHDELETLEYYISLEQIRLEYPVIIQMDIDPHLDLHHCFIPPLMLQPFIENAIWHGILPLKHEGKIIIKISRLSNDRIYICIDDNGIGRKAASKIKKLNTRKHDSLGISIVEHRLSLLSEEFQKEYELSISDRPVQNPEETGTRIELEFPIITSDTIRSEKKYPEI